MHSASIISWKEMRKEGLAIDDAWALEMGACKCNRKTKQNFHFIFSSELSIFETQNKTRSFFHMQFFLAFVNKVANDSNKYDENKNNSLIRRTSENASISHCAQTSIHTTQSTLTHTYSPERKIPQCTDGLGIRNWLPPSNQCWMCECVRIQFTTNAVVGAAAAAAAVDVAVIVLSFCQCMRLLLFAWFRWYAIAFTSLRHLQRTNSTRMLLSFVSFLCRFVRVWVSSFVYWILREHIGANTHSQPTHAYMYERAASMCVGKQYCVFGAVDDANEIVLW